jgi:hypothetical protein
MPLSKYTLLEVMEKFHLPSEFLEITLEEEAIFLWIDPGSFILKTPRLGGRQVAVAFSSDSNQMRCMAQGLNSKEFREIFRDRRSNFNAMIEELLKLLLNAHSSNIKDSTETLQIYESAIATISKQIRNLDDANSDVYIALNRAQASLGTASSSTRYIKHLLEHISACGFPMDRRRQEYFRSIANARIDEIDCLKGEIDEALKMLMFGAVLGSRRDSASQSLTSLLTFTLLPATFTAVSICISPKTVQEYR